MSAFPDDATRVARALAEARPRWVAFVARRVPRDVDPEDIVQRALVRALDRMHTLRDPAAAAPWFYRILRRTTADALAARGDAPALATDDALDLAAVEPPGVDELAAACACVTAVLGGLRPEYAEVLRRVVLDEATVHEAAAELAITPNNAAVRLHRARGALRERIEACCGVTTLRACLDCTCDIDGRCGGEAPA